MALKTLEQKIKYRIARSKDSVFLIRDFADLSDPAQVSRALRSLEKQEKIQRISRGIYAKAKKSPLTGDTITVKPISSLAKDALKKLGVEVVTTTGFEKYNQGETNQIPLGRQIAVKNSRVSRKFEYKGRKVTYEYR